MNSLKPPSFNHHAALRALERGVSPDDVRLILKYGTRQPDPKNKSFTLYRHGSVVVIYDPRNKRVVTCYRDDRAEERSA